MYTDSSSNDTKSIEFKHVIVYNDSMLNSGRENDDANFADRICNSAQ